MLIQTMCVHVYGAGTVSDSRTHTSSRAGARQCVRRAASMSPSSVIIAINSLLAAFLSVLSSSASLHHTLPPFETSSAPYIPPCLHPSGLRFLNHKIHPPLFLPLAFYIVCGDFYFVTPLSLISLPFFLCVSPPCCSLRPHLSFQLPLSRVSVGAATEFWVCDTSLKVGILTTAHPW